MLLNSRAVFPCVDLFQMDRSEHGFLTYQQKHCMPPARASESSTTILGLMPLDCEACRECHSKLISSLEQGAISTFNILLQMSAVPLTKRISGNPASLSRAHESPPQSYPNTYLELYSKLLVSPFYILPSRSLDYLT